MQEIIDKKLLRVDSAISQDDVFTPANNVGTTKSPNQYANEDDVDLDRSISFVDNKSKINNGGQINMSYDGDEVNNGLYRRQKKQSIYSAAPVPITNNINSYNRQNINRPVSVSGVSNRSQHSHSEHEHHIPPPSTEREKFKMTRRYLATVFALCYTIFLIVFGGVLFISNAIVSQYPVAEAFCIYMLCVGFLYFIFLYIDIRIHIQKAKHALKEREKREEYYNDQMAKASQQETGPFELNSRPNGLNHVVVPFAPVLPVSHRYCFATGRHGEFFYLKLGAAWFCFGLLIHSALIISYQVIFLTSTDPTFAKCASVLGLVVEIMFPLYSLLVLFFIFKYANVIINENRGLARVALMHIIGTSLAFWIFTIVRETVDAIAIALDEDYYDMIPDVIKSNKTLLSQSSSPNIPGIEIFECPKHSLHTIYRQFSPYLYPFIIEFCILVVGIFYLMWANINQCPKKLSAPGHDSDVIPHPELDGPFTSVVENPSAPNAHNHVNHTEQTEQASIVSEHCNQTVEHDSAHYKSNLVVYADCHASSRGLFAGLILLVLTIVFIILFFVAVNEEAYIDTGIIVNSSFELIVLVVLIIAVIVAYFQTTKLDVNTHPISPLDDVLLFIAIPAFISETIFSMVPAIYNGSALNICIIMSQIIQILIQTPWIIDGMRRCANHPMLRKRKPGRELVTFLTIANVSLWVFKTFSVKTGYTGDERYEFYGYVVWSILNHLSLPLIMFYRFHASVCLVDIWRHAYEPGGGH